MTEVPASPDTNRYVLVYSEDYVVDIGPHVFPVAKYPMVADRLVRRCGVGKDEFIDPPPAPRDELALVHTAEFLDDLELIRWTDRTMTSELPLTREIVNGYFVAAAGTTLAAREAMRRRGFGIHVGGGFHHAFAGHAEGFCYINDVAVAIRVLQKENLIHRAAVVDCDLHQGNGTAHIFLDDPSVFTFSIHQENNYPAKQRSDVDIGLRDGAGDDEYLEALATVIPARLDAFEPDLAIFVAGADPFEHDLLGGLALSRRGLARRDEIVVGYCAERSIPIVSVLAGGYASDTEDTIEIHTKTCQTMLEAARSEKAEG